MRDESIAAVENGHCFGVGLPADCENGDMDSWPLTQGTGCAGRWDGEEVAIDLVAKLGREVE